ncbi:MAG: hypothetical protein JSV65_15930 [Armatimonadota bacterium]|nr:MAG: hypothetical protein JSV65_15930 [Armatimonadota bacterium]
MRHVLAVACVTVFLGACAFAADPQSATAEENAYVFDGITLDSLDQWEPIGRTTVGLSPWPKEDPYFSLEVEVVISKAGQMVHGIQRRGLGLPLPTAVRFWVFGEHPYLWVVLGDTAGRQVSSRVPLAGLEGGQWSQAAVPLDDTFPMGVGAEPIRDLDSIAILTQESAGENYQPGPLHYHFGHFEAVYPAGVGPVNPTFDRSDLEAMLQPLDASIGRIERLLGDARAAGAETRYATVSLTVLQRYRSEVFSMLAETSDPFVAKRAAEFLLECAARTERELSEAIGDPGRTPRVPDVSLRGLRAREGSYFSGERAVMLAGVCGWFSPGYFEQLSAMAYTSLSIEVGPRSTLPAENERRPAGMDGIKQVLDAAAEHGMVCDLLLSPHYFPGWAREKWPSTDPTGWRQETNGFMPWAITDPHFRDFVQRHLAVAIPEVRDHPALLSYDLINEAWYRLIPDFPADGWRAFRRAHPGMDEWQALSAFGTQNVTDFITWYVGEVHKHDTSHPIHMKTISTEDVMSVDREAVGDVLTANGMDAMPSWPDWSGRLAADFAWPLLRHDFHRSLNPDKPIMDGEYHISGGTYPMPGDYARAALWALALHGRDMSSCWVYDRVDAVSIYWHPAAVEALGHTALDFLRLGPEIHAFQRQRGPLAIHYGGTGLAEAYLACLFQDVDVGVVTDRRIRDGRLSDCKVLVLPAGCEPPEETRRRIRAFEQSGGVVIECPPSVDAEKLWSLVRGAAREAGLRRLVSADEWAVECRSLVLGQRRLLYLINHRREPVAVRLRSDWPLATAVELRTQRVVNAERLRLAPLEVTLLEVAPYPT